ncbi:hypothetical protein [Singulisphaera sp. PoT]|uniref:hypothetical protein n=1 Tax=Singulisphaera sp. PoT TaxID=3411797 RepID=UPI003BF4C765
MRKAIGFGLIATGLATLSVLPARAQAPAIPPPSPAANAKPAATQAAPSGPMIGYEIRWVSTTSPDWRGKFDDRLKVLARKSGSTVWAVDRAGLKAVLDGFQQDTQCNILQSPKVTTPVDQTARVENMESINYVAHVNQVPANPQDPASKPAFDPEVDKVQDGIRLQLSSGKLTPDEGIRVHIALEEARLVRMHTTRVARPAEAKSGESASASESRITKLFRNEGAQSVTATIQVPEVAWNLIDGDWTIPERGALVMSAGPRTVTGKRGKEGYAERVVFISYELVGASENSQASTTAPRLP